MRAILGAAATAVFAIVAAGCSSDSSASADEAEEPTVLQEAYDECAPQVEDGVKSFGDDAPAIDEVMVLEDQGDSLIVTTPDPGGEIASSIAFLAAQCVLEETDAPATVAANMGSTSALSGSQEESWDGVEAVWSYAAGVDNAGFNATFAVTE